MIGKLFIFGSIAIIILFGSLPIDTAISSQNEPISSADRILNVSDENLESVISQYPAFALDCYKDGCGPCEEMSAILVEMAEDFRGVVTFGRMDMKVNLETKKKFNIKSYPTLLLFENGTLIKRIVGFSSKNSIENKIASSLSP